jgi:hypothetical protein
VEASQEVLVGEDQAALHQAMLAEQEQLGKVMPAVLETSMLLTTEQVVVVVQAQLVDQVLHLLAVMEV